MLLEYFQPFSHLEAAGSSTKLGEKLNLQFSEAGSQFLQISFGSPLRSPWSNELL
jgi:hypothetical protein